MIQPKPTETSSNTTEIGLLLLWVDSGHWPKLEPMTAKADVRPSHDGQAIDRPKRILRALGWAVRS